MVNLCFAYFPGYDSHPLSPHHLAVLFLMRSLSLSHTHRLSRQCGVCKVKLGLHGFNCHCGGDFCGLHRYSNEHGCTFDFQAAKQDQLSKANPVVASSSVARI